MDGMQLTLPNKTSQSGQVLLVTLLILAVVLTVGLSIVSRSVIDVKISQQSQESARAFWYAQGGLEEAVRANAGLTNSDPDIINTVSIAQMVSDGNKEYVYPEKLIADNPATIWFVDHNDSGLIGSSFSNPGAATFYWGENNADDMAVEIAFVYYADSAYKIKRYVFDSDTGSGSNFSEAYGGTWTVGGRSFAYKSSEIPLTVFTNLYFARVKVIGNDLSVPLAVKTNVSLPSQGNCFESTAIIRASGITKKLAACQLWATIPGIFDNALFSGTTI